MNRLVELYRKSRLADLLSKYEKFAALAFFIGGFIFDSLTLGRIDRLYDLVVLCLYMTLLTVTLYLYNLADDGVWKKTFLGRYENYMPLAIQFFFGGLSSAYVIYFSRSVSLSKTIYFFIILLVLLFANEFLKKRISNKYLQFSVYFFVSFTFFSFMLPVFVKQMNTGIFIFSGLISLFITTSLIILIYRTSPNTRLEIGLVKMIGLLLLLYTIINLFYFFKLIPPVPLALDSALVAHNVQPENGHYVVTYERNDWFAFWRKHKLEFSFTPGQKVFAFTSIFAPTDIGKNIYHRWQWYNPMNGQWEVVDDIGFEINGGRDEGYRGYTFKNNVKEGNWKVEVITEEELLIGVINFVIVIDEEEEKVKTIQKVF